MPPSIRGFASVRVLAVLAGIAAGCGDPEAFYRNHDADASTTGAGGAGGSLMGAAGGLDTGLAGDGGAGTALGDAGATDTGASGSGGTTGAAGTTTGIAGTTGAAGTTTGAAGTTTGAAGATGVAGRAGGAGTTGAAGTTTGGAGTTGAAGTTTGAAGTTMGTGGAGGMAGAGAGGTGGVNVVTGACAGKVHTAATVIDTFEDGALTNWYEYKDSTTTSTLSPLTIVSPGAASTSKALQLSGSGFQGFGAGAGLMILCTDASAFQGITFWAKGTSGTSNDIALQVAIPQTQATTDGGDCTASCYDHPSKKVALTTTWTQYHVLFTDLAQAGFGAPAKYAGIVMALNWVSIEGPTVNFQIDEISFY